jgi:GT2 family glycosyltransferase
MSFSLVILHHQKADYSRACLESVLRCTARPLQVINVNNGSRDKTASVLENFANEAQKRGIETSLLSFDENIGAVRGRNEALAVASGDYLAFLDNDTLVSQPDWLENLAKFLESRPNCAIVAPKLLFPWAPFDIECCGCAVSPRGKIRYLGRGEARKALMEPQEIQCAISAAWLMRRDLTAQIGVLDEAFSPVQYEDLDYCYRARAAGKTVWSAPHVELFHFEHTTTAGSGDINFAYVTAKNGVLFKKRWGEMFGAENGTNEDDAAWRVLPKMGLDDLDWHALLAPQNGAKAVSPLNFPIGDFLSQFAQVLPSLLWRFLLAWAVTFVAVIYVVSALRKHIRPHYLQIDAAIRAWARELRYADVTATGPHADERHARTLFFSLLDEFRVGARARFRLALGGAVGHGRRARAATVVFTRRGLRWFDAAFVFFQTCF